MSLQMVFFEDNEGEDRNSMFFRKTGDFIDISFEYQDSQFNEKFYTNFKLSIEEFEELANYFLKKNA